MENFSFVLLKKPLNLKGEEKNRKQMSLRKRSDWKEKILAGFNIYIYETNVQRKKKDKTSEKKFFSLHFVGKERVYRSRIFSEE